MPRSSNLKRWALVCLSSKFLRSLQWDSWCWREPGWPILLKRSRRRKSRHIRRESSLRFALRIKTGRMLRFHSSPWSGGTSRLLFQIWSLPRPILLLLLLPKLLILLIPWRIHVCRLVFFIATPLSFFSCYVGWFVLITLWVTRFSFGCITCMRWWNTLFDFKLV